MSIDLAWIAAQVADVTDLQQLASGGQKFVLSGRHEKYGDVVLKIVQPTDDPQRIARELLAVQRLGSDRVPVVYAHGELQSPIGALVFVIEQRIIGHTLAEMLESGALSLVEVVQLAKTLIVIADQAHRAGIVHRDIKPGNIIRDYDGEFWLLDFGIARHNDLKSITPTAAPYGPYTPGYAPPEQFRNIKGRIDVKTDLFAIGITLYEALMGINPFTIDVEDLEEVLQRVQQAPLPPIELQDPAGQELASLIEACTAKVRDHRPPDAAFVLAWLSDIEAKVQES